MPLDPEFKEQTEKLIVDTLSLYENAGASPRISDVWKCENTGDFLCGFFCRRNGGFSTKCVSIIS